MEETDGRSWLGSRLRIIYIAGIALNVIALATAAVAGELLLAVTFSIVIVYLCLRYWMIVSA